MTARRGPKAPAHLGTSGRSLWRRLHVNPEDPDGEPLEFEPRELALLEAACRQADDIARVEEKIREAGIVVTGSQGQPRLSPMLAEVRQGRLALARLIGELALPGFAAEEQPARGADAAATARSRRASKAAQRRWQLHAQRRGDGVGAG